MRKGEKKTKPKLIPCETCGGEGWLLQGDGWKACHSCAGEGYQDSEPEKAREDKVTSGRDKLRY